MTICISLNSTYIIALIFGKLYHRNYTLKFLFGMLDAIFIQAHSDVFFCDIFKSPELENVLKEYPLCLRESSHDSYSDH